MLKSYGVGWWWWGGGGGPCDFGVSPSPFELDFGTLDFGTSDSGLTIINSIRLRADIRSQLEVYELTAFVLRCIPLLAWCWMQTLYLLHINLYSTMLTQPHKSKVDRTVNSQALSAPQSQDMGACLYNTI